MAQDNPQPIKREDPQPIKIYVSGVAFGEKSTPDYTWDGVFVENKKLETKYLPDDVMNQLKKLDSEVSSLRYSINNKKELPTVTSSDSGKFLRVSSAGEWVAEAIASAEGVSF